MKVIEQASSEAEPKRRISRCCFSIQTSSVHFVFGEGA